MTAKILLAPFVFVNAMCDRLALMLLPAAEWAMRRFFPETWRRIHAPESTVAETHAELDEAIRRMQPQPNHSGSSELH